MAYDPTIWKTGDIVSSEKLNKLENGVVNAGDGNGFFVVNVTQESGVYHADKTYEEIVAAKQNGIPCICVKTGRIYYSGDHATNTGTEFFSFGYFEDTDEDIYKLYVNMLTIHPTGLVQERRMDINHTLN